MTKNDNCCNNHNHEHKNNNEHNHNHIHGHNCAHIHTDGTSKGITSAFFMNALFTIIEIFGGIFTNSTAILSDAIHDLGDTISLGIAWKLDKKSNLPENNRLTYGYYRYSVIGSLINIIVLSIGTFSILTSSMNRLFNPEPVNAKGMFLLAIIGVIMNGIAVLKVKNGNKISERVVMLHLMEDVLGWIAVLIVSTILLFVNIPVLDPILSICISIYMIKNIYTNSKILINIIMQSVPYNIDLEDIKDDILSLSNNIKNVLDIKVWSLDGDKNVITLEIDIKDINNYKEYKNEIESILKNKYNAKYVNISIQ